MNRENVRIALDGILANRLRSSLTMLGILIGVSAVIILVAVGTGASVAVQSQIQGLGTNVITVLTGGGFGGEGGGHGNQPGTASTRIVLTEADVTAMESKTIAPDIAQVAPVVNAQATAVYEGETYTPETFVGTTANYSQIRNYPASSGRFFSPIDVAQRQKVAVLGTTVVSNLFGPEVSPIGASVRMGSATFRVIGVLVSKGSNGEQDQDSVVIAPLTAVQDSLTGNASTFDQITVQAVSQDRTAQAQAEIMSILASNNKLSIDQVGSSFRVLNQASLLQTSNASNRVFTVLLGAVAAISLLVGGIGVMNIMLVTVTERTHEIGIRKAIGARRSDILGQFLVESVLLSAIGGVMGVIVGLAGSRFRIVGVEPVVQLYSVVLALGVAVAVGVFFGLYPANRAASLRPIEALRYE